MITCSVHSDNPVSAPPGNAGPAEQLTPDQQIELDTCKAQLSDPARTAKTKREAALLLLTRSYPQATALLKAFLSDSSNRPAQVAVAEAIAHSGRTRPAFVQPLLAMLTGKEPSVRAAAANALARFREPAVLDELIRLAGDVSADRNTRLVVIGALQRVLNKRAVDALVGLLDDADGVIRDAACDALANLTNIRAFGRDPGRWRSWWAQNKDKPRSDWLADLAESLARANLQLEKANAELRRRLAETMRSVYAAAAGAGRDTLLVEMLKDPVGEVRLAGARLVQERLASTAGAVELPEALRAAVRAGVEDPDPAVRRVAATLLVGVRDPQAVKTLSARLAQESDPQVRRAIYQALGRVGDVGVWEELVAGVLQKDPSVAAAAAAALASVVERNSLTEAHRDAAVQALRRRYQGAAGKSTPELREALVGAMGALKDKRLLALMTGALKDPAATVRLSAIKGLQHLGLADSAAAVAPLAGDPEAGVRLAAIAAVGALGGAEHIDAILARTEPGVEPDAAVRKQAWSVVMTLLAKADASRFPALAESLSKRPDTGGHLVDLLRLWTEKIPTNKPEEWIPVRLRLGEALLAQARPAEAAGELAAVHAAMVAAKDPQAGDVWLKWVGALLQANDPAVAARIAEAPDPGQFRAAVELLQKRLEALKGERDWDNLMRLAGEVRKRLSDRLEASARQGLEALMAEARAEQRQADRQRVEALVARLAGADESARSAVVKELAAMKDRAVGPLVEQLRKLVSAAPPNPVAEKAILSVLSGLAPQLSGYDPSAPPAERLKVLDAWAKKLGS